MLKRLLILMMLFSGLVLFTGAQDESPTVTTNDGEGTVTLEPITSTETVTPTLARIVNTLTPTPDVAPWIRHWSEEVIFPQAILFTMLIDVPFDDIADLTLSIQAEGQSPRTIGRSAFTDFLIEREARTEIQYLYNLSARNVFPVLSDISYVWDIALPNGEVVQAPGITRFIPPDVSFVRTDDLNGIVDLIYPVGRVEAIPMQNTLKAVYDRLVNDIGGSHTFNLLLYERINPIDPCFSRGGELLVRGTKGTTIPCDPAVLDASIAAAGFTPFNMLTASAVRQEIALHMIDTFMAATWEARDVPAWFKVGLTQLYIPGGKSYMIEPLRNAARLNDLYSLNRMTNPTEADRVAVLWEAQAYGMVLYMARHLELPALFELVTTIGVESSFSETYTLIMGQSLEALIPSMQTWVFSDTMAADFDLNIYLDGTPLPTRTLTPTEFPASRTPTATATATVTPTPTVTGFLSATPLPSLTPTASINRVTVTPTPLPAGFQRQPTATVTPVVIDEPATNFELDSQTIGIALVIIAAIGLLFVAYLLFGQSKND